MFRGIDDVDWASMEHAYGSAADVPELLRGLASPLPQERETALDGMYGAVHHQGDVYDSTLASIPFLFALAGHAGLPDRGGIVELLASIGGSDDEEGAGDGQDEDFEDDNHAMAHAAVRAGAAVFLDLVTDGDPEVRRAAPSALVRFHGEPPRVLALLRERLRDEPEDGVRPALVEGLGLLARLHPGSAAPAVDCLVSLCDAPHDPGLRLAALGQLASCAPHRLPADLVPTVVALLHTRSQRIRPSNEPVRTSSDTLIGSLRRMRPADEEGAQLLRTLHQALGARTADRIALLKGQLSSRNTADRCNAVWMSAGLFREWRAAYEEPVALIGEQLGSEEERLRGAAVSVLEFLFTLAAPAADRLAALVESGTDFRGHGRATLDRPLKALARCGDARAVPHLAEVLRHPVVPNETGYTIGHLGPAAAPLAPLLRERLAEVPLGSPDTYDRAAPLLYGLGALRYAEAVPEVLRLLHGTPRELRSRDALVKASARTLGAFGARAREAAPALRELLTGENAVTAADALRSVEGDVEAVLPALLGALAPERNAGGRRAAAEALGRAGAAAAPALPGLRRLADSSEVWERTAGACALWDVGGDPRPVLPVFRDAWRQNPYTRGTITACLVRMGGAGAPVHDLVRAELASPRRHRARSGGHGSHDVLDDELLLRDCRAVLEAA
ncbi:HEAT repeat domain-containing protein [Streptomyces triticiradicis]|uniref:HEAT repeat domain-containing protein n=1 Tax=Streptomyces triticiradicis TaxID=2651189 RepID=A0A7J5D671_9ACTN|nr:HEAT repeat domain-containing protein [Streptomyces triticiradicis]KAB1979418.1 HEAT repeat domain-containing protein [Streptomyces triticiradicis]